MEKLKFDIQVTEEGKVAIKSYRLNLPTSLSFEGTLNRHKLLVLAD